MLLQGKTNLERIFLRKKTENPEKVTGPSENFIPKKNTLHPRRIIPRSTFLKSSSDLFGQNSIKGVILVADLKPAETPSNSMK